MMYTTEELALFKLFQHPLFALEETGDIEALGAGVYVVELQVFCRAANYTMPTQ